ncbi:MFS transporter [Deminuibacter soli]|uniref:Beta-carotene 15,15'-monooxygenase n=1 Tax=Deminuibacter soli TaxID=2291815 RepID=A0A3E1ND63_9BACT|nr:beta-carotene 15,15'-monooxygenase [Deminuibacter soli]RFM25764.1 beta-carotene 15,15'-monooxygenase [Deminuibacter soli]
MTHDPLLPVFKQWLPEWLVKLAMLLVILPGLVLFFLPMSNINAGAGHYGAEPADMQFATILFYAGYAGFYSLERRFFSFLAAKEYFILFTVLQIVTAGVCYTTKRLEVLYPLRFIQGMSFCSLVNLSLTIISVRAKTGRGREISFSVFYGLLLCTISFNNFITADIVDSFNYNKVYQLAIFAYLPGLLLLLTGMNNVRFNVKFPLYQLDWQGFVLYATVLVLTGYVLVYGREYYWLEDNRILYSVIAITVLLTVFFIRQLSMKRPYTNPSIFTYRNFNIGVLVLFLMYICRFGSNVTNTFFATVLRFDPAHISYINLLNIAGIVTGVIYSCCMLIQKKHIRLMWVPGFIALLGFHARMYFLFATQANAGSFFIPLFVQGLGVGIIMVPAIVYAVSAVPVALGPSAAGFCLTARFMGFCTSIGLINHFELTGKSAHFNTFRDNITRLNPVVKQALAKQTRRLVSEGMPPAQAAKLANRLLVNNVNGQTQLRFAMDYYELMTCFIICILVLLMLFPYLNRTVAHIRSRKLIAA